MAVAAVGWGSVMPSASPVHECLDSDGQHREEQPEAPEHDVHERRAVLVVAKQVPQGASGDVDAQSRHADQSDGQQSVCRARSPHGVFAARSARYNVARLTPKVAATLATSRSRSASSSRAIST